MGAMVVVTPATRTLAESFDRQHNGLNVLVERPAIRWGAR